jgi:hypothetical protein
VQQVRFISDKESCSCFASRVADSDGKTAQRISERTVVVMQQLELFRRELDEACKEVHIVIRIAIEKPNPRNLKKLTRKVRTANQRLHSLHRAEYRLR